MPVDPPLAGNDQIGPGDAVRESHGVHDDLHAGLQPGTEERDQSGTESAGRSGTGQIGHIEAEVSLDESRQVAEVAVQQVAPVPGVAPFCGP